MVHMEHEGAVYRGKVFRMPEEIWHPKKRAWVPYKGSKLKPIDWGSIIDGAEVERLCGSGAAGGKIAAE